MLDLVGGISGDMAVGALLDLGVPLELLRERLAGVGLLEVRLEAGREQRHGITGTRFQVRLAADQAPADSHHGAGAAHRPYRSIRRLLEQATLPEPAGAGALAIFKQRAEAEAHIHGLAEDEVQFHEVGAWDSIADIVCAAAAIAHLAPDAVLCSPVPLGHGQVRAAHGVLPVPAPATLRLLRGFPVLQGTAGPALERTTPTGAAILAALAQPAPATLAYTPQRIGIGVGSADPPEVPNLLRAVWGTAAGTGTPAGTGLGLAPGADWVQVAVCNLDDCSPEWIGYAQERLLELGALDVALVPVQMKKNRPGTQLQVLYPPALHDRMLAVLLEETTTLGVRVQTCQRVVLLRERHEVQTPWGPLPGKLARIGGRPRFTPEFEACRELAHRLGLPLQQVYRAAEQAFAEQSLAEPALAAQPPPGQD